MVQTCNQEWHWDGFGRPSDVSETGLSVERPAGGHHLETGVSESGQTGVSPESIIVPKTIKELLYFYPCCPPDAFYQTKQFYKNKHLNYLNDDCKKIRVALRNWCAEIREWSTRDFEKYYRNVQVKPYFNAYARDSELVYYDVPTSVEIADKLLYTQFDDHDTIRLFLIDVLAICDKKIPKRNSMCIISPPSAGKNFFFDPIASFYINYGMFGTANKNNNFSWADGAGRRIVLWNKPNYEQYHVEKMKELLAGDTTRVHVKYKGDQPLQGPPIFLLTNKDLSICNDPAFKDRLVTYHWSAAPFLVEYKLKLHPLFWVELLKKYEIDLN